MSELDAKQNNLSPWLVIGGWLILFIVAWGGGLVLGSLIKGLVGGSSDIQSIFSQIVLYGWQALVAWLGIRLILRMRPRDTIMALKPGWLTDLGAGVLIAAVVLLISFSIQIIAGWLVFDGWVFQTIPFTGWIARLLVSVVMWVLIALNEELLYRGYLLTGLNRRWSEWLSVAAMGLLFALPHLLFVEAEGMSIPALILALAMLGGTLGWAYLRTESLWLPLGIHWAWNFLSGDVFNLGAKTGGTSIGAMTHHAGPAWLVSPVIGAFDFLPILLTIIGIWLWLRWRSVAAGGITKA